MIIKKCVILVGGKGSRLKKLTTKTAKPLLKINHRPFLDYILSHVAKSQITKIYLICSYKYQDFKKYYENKLFFGKKIICIKENKPLDTAGALYSIKKKINEDFLLLNGDSFINFNVNNFIKNFKKNANIKMLLCKNVFYKSNKKLNRIYLDYNEIVNIKKKGMHMNAGAYLIKKKLLLKIKKEKKSLENDIIPNLIRQNKVQGVKCNKKFIDIGTPENYEKSSFFLKNYFFEKAVFLDRDGVINEDKHYVYKLKDFKLLDGILEGIKYLNKLGYLVFVVTNQSGIGRGYYTVRDMKRLHCYLDKKLLRKNADIEEYYYCPHHPTYGKGKFKKKCYDRKPFPGMILKIISKYNININKSFMIGDKKIDRLAAKKANVRFFYKKKINFLKQVSKIKHK